MAISTQDKALSGKAWHRFWRSMAWLGIACVVMVVAALAYLSLSGQLTLTLVLAVTFGMIITIVLGGGLMAAGFFSSNSGHDDRAAGAIPVTPAPGELNAADG